MAVVSMKQLLEAGVHFGHQTRRWNPKMARFIFTERNGIYIIDLQKTVKKVDEAYNFVRDLAAEGGKVLFVGTKKQAQESIKNEAERCNQYFVNERWLGGMLTNFQTIEKRVKRLKVLEKQAEDGTFEVLPKKEPSPMVESGGCECFKLWTKCVDFIVYPGQKAQQLWMMMDFTVSLPLGHAYSAKDRALTAPKH